MIIELLEVLVLREFDSLIFLAGYYGLLKNPRVGLTQVQVLLII